MAMDLELVDLTFDSDDEKENEKKRPSTTGVKASAGKKSKQDSAPDSTKSKSKSKSTEFKSKSKSKGKSKDTPGTKEKVIDRQLNINTHRLLSGKHVKASFPAKLGSFLEKELRAIQCEIGFHPFENTNTQMNRMKTGATVVVNSMTISLECSKTKSTPGFLFNNDMFRQLVHKYLKKKNLDGSVVKIRCQNNSMDLIVAGTIASA
jgi:hypothetical protein